MTSLFSCPSFYPANLRRHHFSKQRHLSDLSKLRLHDQQRQAGSHQRALLRNPKRVFSSPKQTKTAPVTKHKQPVAKRKLFPPRVTSVPTRFAITTCSMTKVHALVGLDVSAVEKVFGIRAMTVRTWPAR